MPAYSSTPFQQLSAQFRGSIVYRWAKDEDQSAAEAARTLTEHARDLNIISREIAVPGAALSEWNKRKQPPMWAALAAFDLILKRGWRPVSNEEWAGFASLILKLSPCVNLDCLSDSLPEDIDMNIASGWIAAAIEEDQHYRVRKKMAAKPE